MAITKNKSDIARSEQIVLNRSVDDEFEILAVELLGYDPSSQALKRIAVNADGEIQLDTAALDARYVNVTGDTMTGNLNFSGSADLILPYIGSPTYDGLKDWFNTTQSTGKLSGGNITDNGDGTVSVSAGTGLIRATNSDTATVYFFDWSAENSLSLTDNSANYIYVEYNAGNPQVVASTTLPSDKNTNVMLGIVYRDGTSLHIATAGQVVTNYAKHTLWKDLEINGKFQRVSGLIIADAGTRHFSLTSGYIYAGLTKLSIPAFDSSGTDTFDYYYRDGAGGWTKVSGQTQIDNLHYDDGSGTLATLSDPLGWRTYYGVHWVYQLVDGHIAVVYGRGDYLIDEADAAQPPLDLPDIIQAVGGLVGKIIVEKSATELEKVQSAFDQIFSPSLAIAHNSTTDIQGGTTDEYYHLTAADYNALTDADAQLTDLQTTGSPTFNDITITTPSSIYSLNHDNFAGFVANEHIDWTNATENLSTTGSIDTAKEIEAAVFDYELKGADISSHFRDNSASYPSGWTEVDAAYTTNTQKYYSFWYLLGIYTNTSWKYRIRTGVNLENDETTNHWSVWQVGPIYIRDYNFTDDVDYYFGMYRDNAGTIDENTYCRVHIQWDSANNQWQIRGEESDGTTSHVGSWIVFNDVFVLPIWIRFGVQNSTNKLTRSFFGTHPFPDMMQTLLWQAPSSAPTWGQYWIQFHRTRGDGGSDYILIGALDKVGNYA